MAILGPHILLFFFTLVTASLCILTFLSLDPGYRLLVPGVSGSLIVISWFAVTLFIV